MEQRVSVTDLLANPAAYDGQRVEVDGFFVYFKEEVALYPIASRDRSLVEAIKLVHPAIVHGERRTKELSRQWIRVVGTFHRRNRPYLPGELSNIQAIEPQEHASEL